MLYTRANTDERCSSFDIFMFMFPPRALDLIFMATNEQLELRNKRTTTQEEILKFFGIVILATRYEFSSHQSFFSTTKPSKYDSEEGSSFGTKTGIGHSRFHDLWQYIRFPYQPLERLEDLSSETYRWQLVDGVVKRFNEHRTATFFP